MVTTPAQVLAPVLFGLFVLAALAVAVFLLRRAFQRPVQPDISGDEVAMRRLPPKQERTRRLLLLAVALTLLVFAVGGQNLTSLFWPAGKEDPQDVFGPVTRRVTAAGGATLAIEESGPAEAPRIVFTHGWGADRREWSYARRQLESRFRVITWDLPGLGQSTPIPSGDYALTNLASALRTVVDATGPGDAILVGHSIGGMINLTLCKQNGGSPGPRVRGLVELDTTYTNPVRTVQGHETQEKLQPVYEPLLHVIIAASPIVRALNWFGYQSGLMQLQTASSSFAGTETREQLDFVSKYPWRSSPAVVARGTLGMMHWDASDVLGRITVPVLIVSGDQDTTTLPVASDHMAASIPDNKRLSVNPAAHMGPIEQHRRYNEAVAAFAQARFNREGESTRSKAAGSR